MASGQRDRLSASSSPKKDTNGHTIDQGLPLTKAFCQPLLCDQAYLRQDCQIPGGQGVGQASDSQELEAQGPTFPQGFPGTSVWDGALSSDSSAYLSVTRAVYIILDTWLDQYPEDFFQPPEFPCLKVLLAYMGLNMPGSDLERHAQLLLSQLQHLEPTEPEAGGKEDGGVGQLWACGGDRVGHTEQASIACGWAESSE